MFADFIDRMTLAWKLSIVFGC